MGQTRKIWIINHNAMPPSLGGLNRHHYFTKYLIEAGYGVRIFTASNVHNSGVNMISGNAYCEKVCDGIAYTFVRTGNYTGNGISRIKNMLEFPARLWRICSAFVRAEGKPDVVYTSSPDIFACFRAMGIAKKLKVPCIFEVRDLWPLSIVAYGMKKEGSLFISAMFKLEKWMYENADRLIFTSEGGRDYLIERRLDKTVDLSKVYHIGNGVDLAEFDYNLSAFTFDDSDLDDDGFFKGVYAGSMRHVNNIEALVEAAGILQNRGRKFKLILYGDGNRREHIQKLIEEKNISNIALKTRVDKKFVPYILSKTDLCLLHFRQSEILRYGHSNNKLLDYLAAGKPVLSDVRTAYDIVEGCSCGISIGSQAPADIADAIEQMMDMPADRYAAFCQNARAAAKSYDYKALTQKLIEIIEGLLC